MKNWKDKYDWVDDFHNGRAVVKLNQKYGFVDLDGNEVVPPKYDNVGYFKDGRAVIIFMGFKGEIDLNGKEYFSQEVLAKLRNYRLPGIINSL
jgi:hypothetical protein